MPRSFGVEQSSRLFQGTEAHGFTGRDGAIYLIGHNSNTRLDVIEPNGVGGTISYRYPQGPLHVIAVTDPVIPGCDPSTIMANFTKSYITEGMTSDGDSILLAVWGWASGAPAACPDVRNYGDDSHAVYFAYSLDAGRTWWNRTGSASRTAPNCTDPADCGDPSHGIAMDDPAFQLTSTRQRDKRAAWYDAETDTIYLAFAKSTWCSRGVCIEPNVTSPGALMLLRFQLGSGGVFERKVADGDYTHIPAIHRAPDGRIYLYAASGGLAYEHVSDDDGASWSRTEIEMMGRVHGHASLPCAPSTIVTAGATSNGPFYLFTRTLPHADRRVFSPVADAYVQSTTPASNYGSADQLRAKADGPAYRAYLKFDVAGVTTGVERATLRLRVTDPGPDGGSVYAVSNAYAGTSTPWTESGLRWNNAPVIAGTALDSAGLVTSGGWVELDVTAAVAGSGTRSFGIRTASTNSVFYASRQSSTPPELVVEVASAVRACSDRRDNDRDGLIDYPADPGCYGARDGQEADPRCGLGFELSLLIPVLRAIRARRSPPRDPRRSNGCS